MEHKKYDALFELGFTLDNNEITEALRECKQLARECLDKGLLREAIATMFLLLLLAGMSMDESTGVGTVRIDWHFST